MRATAAISYAERISAQDAARLVDRIFGGSEIIRPERVRRVAPGRYEMQATDSFRATVTQLDANLVALTLTDWYGYTWFRRKYLIKYAQRLSDRRPYKSLDAERPTNRLRAVKCLTTGRTYENRFAAAHTEGARATEVYRCCSGFQARTHGKEYQWA